VSPKRGDRVAPPPVGHEWDLRFATGEAASGWEELCRQAKENTRRAYEAIRTDPRPNPPTGRHHRLKGKILAHGTRDGRLLERWQYEVTAGGRIWYLVDDTKRTVWIEYAGTAHPKITE